MMKTIVEEKQISFKELEQKIFSYVCELGREITTAMLEAYDKELAEGRDKKNYRDKGIRTTTIKTVYGEVSYGRHVYQTKLEDGKKACVYLLDEAMQMEKIGLISTNLAEKLAMTVTEAPYRVTAETISSTCGQSISAGGVVERDAAVGGKDQRRGRTCGKTDACGPVRGKKGDTGTV